MLIDFKFDCFVIKYSMPFIHIQSLVQFILLIILLLNGQQIQVLCRGILNSDKNRKMSHTAGSSSVV